MQIEYYHISNTNYLKIPYISKLKLINCLRSYLLFILDLMPFIYFIYY